MICKTQYTEKKEVCQQQSDEKTLVRVLFRMKEECGLFFYIIYQLYHLVDAVSFSALPTVQNCAPFGPCSIRKEMCIQVTQHSEVLS